jgi:hypothetical protein
MLWLVLRLPMLRYDAVLVLRLSMLRYDAVAGVASTDASIRCEQWCRDDSTAMRWRRYDTATMLTIGGTLAADGR